MKKTPILIALCAIGLLSIGAVIQQTTGIYILSPTDQVQLKIRSTVAQTQPWLDLVDRGTVKFSLPATGIIPLVYGGTGASTAKGARTALGLPEGVTNTVPIYTTQTAAEMRALMELPEGVTNAAMPLLDVTTATAARTALGLPEILTNTAAGLRTAIGIQAGSVTTAADGTVTNTFATAFTQAPVIVIAPIGNAVGVTNNFTVTESNFVYTAGAPSIVAKWVAFEP